VNFEWDEKKRQANITKHGLDFKDAEAIFSAPVVATIDRRKSYSENRWAALGQLKGVIVYLAYTIRGEVIRVISMRRASKKERKIYEEYFQN
jgi:uncharacterized DUF497 family protein